jgi:hypothetical protein
MAGPPLEQLVLSGPNGSSMVQVPKTGSELTKTAIGPGRLHPKSAGPHKRNHCSRRAI